MKIKKERIHSMDLVSEELEAIKAEGEDFWRSVQDLLRYGIPSCDQKGHNVDFRVKIRPIQADIIAGIRERLPEGWFKNNGSLFRSIIAIGCKTIFKFLENKAGEWDEWVEVLNGLNMISKQQRLNEFHDDVKNLKSKVLAASISSAEKVKVVDLLSRLEKKMMEGGQ